MKKLFAVILSLGLIMAPVPVVSTARAQAGGGMLQQLVGIGNGIVGASIVSKCQMASLQYSIMAYMAGSVVYILGEITTAKKKAADIGDLSSSLDGTKAGMTEGGDYQKAALQAQLDNEKSNLEFIKKRRNFVMATTAIYAVAIGLAVWEFIRSLPPPPAGIGQAIPSTGACTPNPASNKLWVMALGAAYGTLASSGGNVTLGGMATGVAMGVAVQKLMPLIFGAADAAEGVSIPMMNNALSRIAFFTIMTGLVTAITIELNKSKKESEERIAKIEEVMDQLGGEENAIDEGGSSDDDANDPSKGNKEDENRKKYDLKRLAKLEKRKTCLSRTEISSSACKNAVKLKRMKIDPKLNIPALHSAAHTATDLANAMAAGDSSRAEVLAGELGNSAARLTKIKDGLLKKVNDHLVASGKKPLDIEGETKRQLAQMNAAFGKVGGGGAGMSLADLGNPGEAGVSDTTAKDSSASGEVKGEGGAPEVAMENKGMDFSDLDVDGDLASGDVGQGGNAVASLSDSLSEFESNESDISKKSDVSIFKQLSNRYFLNYTKIFQRKEIAPPLAEPAQAQK